MLKLILVLILYILLVSFSVRANPTDEILGPEPTPQAEQFYDRSMENQIGIRLAALGGIGATSYTLTSQGYNVSLPLTISYLWGFSGQYQFPKSHFSIALDYSSQRTSFENVSSVLPSNINLTSNFYSGYVQLNLSPEWAVGVGYGYGDRLATRTSPQDVISSAVFRGPMMMAEYSHLSTPRDTFGARFYAFFPNYYEETSTSSGYSNFSYRMQLRPYYRRQIKQDVFAGAGVWIEYNYSAFSGTGTRLTTDARESLWKIYAPVFLEFSF
ncbi:MAG: hypothetical protein IT289_04835 [Oligoflexia bacterium]|nr:hypothetical protein [Oligoflexia bacterium]